MLDALMQIFGKKEKSGKIAKERLQVVLIRDRANLSPEVMDNIKNDIIEVLSKYVKINRQDMEISLSDDQDSDSAAIVVNVPVSRERK
ncbi:MAG: cell division topological specificity factor MinE [Selenomonadaceae bacterium]|nr:cell division topological specificity factor MinE [Selenomonadaceae bacterium]MDY2684722.1 cell division topological specificity factor MinE [Selenomonadaceae bacterium]